MMRFLSSIAPALALLVAPAAAQEDGDTIYLYCEGTPATRTSLVYVSPVFSHRLDMSARSVDRATQRFRERLAARYDEDVGATCFRSRTWNQAETERDAFVRHRSANGYRVEHLPWTGA